ncbi:Major Facilitator Superfamily transporter [Sanguibacter keddieii DSM 10542]|uniref:Major Facilitator Superfamily transporter n=1 Tax=Sanguibacter keddieii (strain ATCC 51767 / DSM 10542 / NCFB 3025 / ST-74) TaxID=446469 RepID=D1BE58_SANKS|nr:Major Facilitator Superfamily transporter [Sanguibacter keddieii DSM 10542]
MRPIVWPVLVPTTLIFGAEGAAMVVLGLSAIAGGASLALAALVVATVGIGQLAGSIPAGQLTTRYGERRVLVVASLASTVTWAGAALVSSPAALAAVGFVGGVASAAFAVARQSYTIDVVPHAYRARAMSLLGGSGRVGLVLGPLAGAGLQVWFGLAGGFVVASAAAALAALTLLVVREPGDRGVAGAAGSSPAATASLPATSRDRAAAQDAVASDPRRTTRPATLRELVRAHASVLATVGIGVVVINLARSLRPVLVPLALSEAGADAHTTSLVVAAAAAAELMLFYPAGVVMDRYGRRVVAVSCSGVMGVGLILMGALGALEGLAGIVAGAVLLGIGSGIGSGVVKTLGADAAPVRDRATFLGVWNVLGETGGAAGPLALSALTAVASLAGAGVVLGVVALAGAVGLTRWLSPGRAGPWARPGAAAGA